MIIDNDMSDDALLREIGSRLARLRLRRNLKQAQLAKEAGVGVNTLHRLETGHSIDLRNFARILRALGLQANCDSLVPVDDVDPIQRVSMKAKTRKRASRKPPPRAKAQPWKWGDEE